MLLLFETAAGFALFKVLDEQKLKQTDNIWKDFETPDKASQIVQLVCFRKFKDVQDAVDSASSLLDGKLGKDLKKLLKKNVLPEAQQKLAVADNKLGNLIKDKLAIGCITSDAVQELMRGIRTQLDALVSELPRKELAAMQLGLAHSLSRYKLKFSADKVDTMIVQAVSLLDDLDKELNNYVMRCREWYGWHFPELSKLLQDHQAFAKTVKAIGMRQNARNVDLSDVLPEDIETKVKEEATISMGTDISDNDVLNIRFLCDQIIEISSYRTQLHEYLKNRMNTLAPNLTSLVGELVGGRLISHAGSLLGLAKQPASTIQILGAEKALFRALKTKRDTPKYGIIYHAQLLGQAHPKIKGKVSRMLAAKVALATRVDALSEAPGVAAQDAEGEQLPQPVQQLVATVGLEHRAYLERRITTLKDAGSRQISGQGKAAARSEKYTFKSEVVTYDESADSTIASSKTVKRELKVEMDEGASGDDEQNEATSASPKKKTRLDSAEQQEQEDADGEVIVKKSKKKKRKSQVADDAVDAAEVEETAEVEDEPAAPASPKKKKKKQKQAKVENVEQNGQEDSG